MSHGGGEAETNPAVKTWVLQNLREGENPWRVGSPADLDTNIRKSSDIYQVPATPSPGPLKPS